MSCYEKLLVKGSFKAILVSRSYCYLEESSVYLKSSQSILEMSQVRQKTSRKSQKQPKNLVYDRTRSVSQHLYALLLMPGDRFQSRLRSLINLCSHWLYATHRLKLGMIKEKKREWLFLANWIWHRFIRLRNRDWKRSPGINSNAYKCCETLRVRS